jgi:phosphate transport system permease protein
VERKVDRVTGAPEPPLPPARGPGSLARQVTWQTVRELLIRWVLFACAGLSVLTTLAIIAVLLSEAVFSLTPHKAFFQQVSVVEFFTETRWTPDFEGEGQQHYGILPLALGTLQIVVLSGLVGLPIGLLAAIYLSEYAAPRTRAVLKPVLELLAGVPTIVYGYFALKFITPYVLRPVFQDWLGFNVDTFNALSGGIVVGIMIMPMVCSLSEDVLRAVPQSLREAGYALGSTRFDVSVRIVVPSALSGILASFILALSRGIGETMAVAIASGQQAQLTLNPLSQIQTMTAFIVNVMKGDVPPGSTLETSIYAVALVLFAVTLTLNVISQMILRRFREVYQ